MMELEIIERDFSICKIKRIGQADFRDEFCFVGKTDEEISLVCSTELVPAETLEREDGWRCFRISGILDFSLIGILSKISAVLAEHQIGIFAVSTYNTDYVFTKRDAFPRAVSLLKERGYRIVPENPHF